MEEVVMPEVIDPNKLAKEIHELNPELHVSSLKYLLQDTSLRVALFDTLEEIANHMKACISSEVRRQ
jgi:hypothetical protein